MQRVVGSQKWLNKPLSKRECCAGFYPTERYALEKLVITYTMYDPDVQNSITLQG